MGKMIGKTWETERLEIAIRKNCSAFIIAGKNNTVQLEDYTSISTPSLLLLGDRDKMITLDETLAVYKQLPNAQLGILPDTAHPIEKVNIDMLAFFLQGFIGR